MIITSAIIYVALTVFAGYWIYDKKYGWWTDLVIIIPFGWLIGIILLLYLIAGCTLAGWEYTIERLREFKHK